MNAFQKLRTKYKEMQIEAKASVWYTLCNILQKGISFLVIPIYVRVLSTGEYGKYTVFQSWRDILVIFATLNLYCGVFTKAMVDYEDDRNVYISCMQGLSTVITMMVMVLYLSFTGFWNKIFDMDTATMLLMFAYFVFCPAFSFWSVRKKVENKYISMVIITLLVSVATPVISLLLLFNTMMREKAVIYGYLLVQCAVGAFFYIMQFVQGKTFFHKKYWKHGIKYNIPLVPHYLSLVVMGQADRIMIKNYCGENDAGIYSLAYQISAIMNIFISAINGSFVPWLYHKLKDKEYTSITKVSSQLCILMAIITIGITLVAPEVVMIAGTQEYRAAIWIIPSVALSVLYTFCYNLFCSVEFYYNRTWFVMFASIFGAILNIILNAIFIPEYGFTVAGYTTMVCYFLFMVMHYFFMCLICNRENLGGYVFNNKFIFILCLIISVLALAIMTIYNFELVRYVIVVVLMIIFYKSRKIFMYLKK